jgi:hypothetical protein
MVLITRKLGWFLLMQFVLIVLTAEVFASSIVFDGQVPVYKFTDSKGHITYSASGLTDFTHVEKMTINAPPSQRQLDESKRRFVEMKMAAEKLNDAREQLDSIREQNELKRLQRLALINQARPLVVTREFIYPTYSYRFKRKHVHGGYQGRPAQLPSSHPHPRGLSLPSSSFPATFH